MNRYPAFFEKTFLSEGYFQNNSKDKGNYFKGKLYGTICGITARDYYYHFSLAYELFRLEKYELLKDYCMKFYAKAGYWSSLYNEIDDSSLAFKLWDLGVNKGVVTAVKLLQKVLIQNYGYNLEMDGVFGQTTLRCTNEATYQSPVKINAKVGKVARESILYAYYAFESEKRYRSLSTFWEFGKGWLLRLWYVFNGVPDKIEIETPEPKDYERTQTK